MEAAPRAHSAIAASSTEGLVAKGGVRGGWWGRTWHLFNADNVDFAFALGHLACLCAASIPGQRRLCPPVHGLLGPNYYRMGREFRCRQLPTGRFLGWALVQSAYVRALEPVFLLSWA